MKDSLLNIYSHLSNIENAGVNIQDNFNDSLSFIFAEVLSFIIENRVLIFILLCALLIIINIFYMLYNNSLKKQGKISKEDYLKIKKDIYSSRFPRISKTTLKCIAITLIILSIYIVVFNIWVIDNIIPWFESQNEYMRAFIGLAGLPIALLLIIGYVIYLLAKIVIWILLVILCLGIVTRFLYINVKLNKYLKAKKDISKE